MAVLPVVTCVLGSRGAGSPVHVWVWGSGSQNGSTCEGGTKTGWGENRRSVRKSVVLSPLENHGSFHPLLSKKT